MKSLVPMLLLCGVVLLAAGCSTGKFMPQHSVSATERAWLAGQKIPLSLIVVPAAGLSATNKWEMRSAANLATNLARTGLFAEVKMNNQSSSADLLVRVRSANGVMRCGNPAMMARATLGLWRDTVAYSYSYDFDLMSTRTGRVMPFAKIYHGSYRTGYWPARDEAFIELLKFELAQRRAEIESLAK